MGTKTLSLLSFLLLTGCGGVHIHSVYRDGDRGVFYQDLNGVLTQCELAYSDFDGTDFYDFYGSPCLVSIKRKATEIKYNDPRPQNHLP